MAGISCAKTEKPVARNVHEEILAPCNKIKKKKTPNLQNFSNVSSMVEAAVPP